MAIYSRLSIQNFENWWFLIKKSKRIAQLIKEQDDIDKIILYAKDLSKTNYEFLSKKREDAGTGCWMLFKYYG